MPYVLHIYLHNIYQLIFIHRKYICMYLLICMMGHMRLLTALSLSEPRFRLTESIRSYQKYKQNMQQALSPSRQRLGARLPSGSTAGGQGARSKEQVASTTLHKGKQHRRTPEATMPTELSCATGGNCCRAMAVKSMYFARSLHKLGHKFHGPRPAGRQPLAAAHLSEHSAAVAEAFCLFGKLNNLFYIVFTLSCFCWWQEFPAG